MSLELKNILKSYVQLYYDIIIWGQSNLYSHIFQSGPYDIGNKICNFGRDLSEQAVSLCRGLLNIITLTLFGNVCPSVVKTHGDMKG